MKIRLNFLLLFITLSLFVFNTRAATTICTNPVPCTTGCGNGLKCDEIDSGLTCNCFNTDYSYSTWNPETCNLIGDYISYEWLLSYTCDTNMDLSITTPYKCVCQSGYYMVPTNDPLTATGCNDCSVAETDGRVCTCAGVTAEPDCNFPVTLDWNDGSGTLTSTTAHCTGTSCACPDDGVTACVFPIPSATTPPSGYSSFEGWNTAANGSGTNYSPNHIFTLADFPSGPPYTLYARWKKTITFDSNGGTPATPDESCYHGGYLTVPEIPSTAPLVFHGLDSTYWYSDPNGGAVAYTAGGSSPCDAAVSPVYPKWNYTITYNGNCSTVLGGDPVPSANTNCIKGTTDCALVSPIPAMTCSGYVLDTSGWESSTGTPYSVPGTINNSTGTPAGDITLYARWNPDSFVIELDPNGGSGGTSSITEIYDVEWLGAISSITIPTRVGYSFDGYFEHPTSGTSPIISALGNLPAPDTFVEDTTLYAHWTEVVCSPGEWLPAGTSICEECPIGYYCLGDDNAKHLCPKATTSLLGSDAKTDCYLRYGSKICDSYGACYYFPSGTTHIQWQGI